MQGLVPQSKAMWKSVRKACGWKYPVPLSRTATPGPESNPHGSGDQGWDDDHLGAPGGGGRRGDGERGERRMCLFFYPLHIFPLSLLGRPMFWWLLTWPLIYIVGVPRSLGLALDCLFVRCRGPLPHCFPSLGRPACLEGRCGVRGISKLTSWSGGAGWVGSEGPGEPCGGRRSLWAASKSGHSTRCCEVWRR